MEESGKVDSLRRGEEGGIMEVGSTKGGRGGKYGSMEV
jgi:hypothetical protein